MVDWPGRQHSSACLGSVSSSVDEEGPETAQTVPAPSSSSRPPTSPPCSPELRTTSSAHPYRHTLGCQRFYADWLIEHGFMSAPTQYRLYGRQFLQVWWPNQQCQSTEGGWLVIQRGLSLTRLTSPCYNNTKCMHILYKKII